MRLSLLPDPLPVRVTNAAAGKWKIDQFNLEDKDIQFDNLRAVIRGNEIFRVKAGTYVRLHHCDRGIVMSNTSMEVRTHEWLLRHAEGHVLLNGLGLGMALNAVLNKPQVESVTVIEIDADVIGMIAPAFKPEVDAGRVKIIQADAFDYKPARGEKYAVAWHDIWDDISASNLQQMTRLKRKWARRVILQRCWSEEIARRDARRW